MLPLLHVHLHPKSQQLSRATLHDAQSQEDKTHLARLGLAPLAQALTAKAGFRVHTNASGNHQTQFSVRGFGGNAGQNTLVLLNGLPVIESDLGGYALGVVPLPLIREVQYQPSSQSVRYGSGAIAGVINLITDVPVGSHQSFQLATGSNDTLKAFGSLSHQFNHQQQISFSVFHSQTKGYRAHSRSRLTTAAIDFANKSSQWQLWSELLASEAKADYPGPLDATTANQNPRAASSLTDWSDNHPLLWQVKFARKLSVHNTMHLDMNSRYNHGQGSLSSSPFRDTRYTLSLMPWLATTVKPFPLPTKIQTGGLLYQGAYQTDFTTVNYHKHIRTSRAALYSLITQTIQRQWQLQVGARLATNQNNNLPGKQSDDAFVYRGQLNYHPNSHWRTELSYATNYRFPLAEEDAFTATGAPLKTQTGQDIALSIHHRSHYLQVALSMYQLRLKNEISFVPRIGPFNFGANRNLDPTRRLGLTTDIAIKPVAPLTIRVSANAVRARFRQGPFKGKHIPLVPSYWIRNSISWHLMSHWQLHIEQYWQTQSHADSDFTNSGTLVPGYALFNASVQYHRSRFTITVSGLNLLNKHTFAYVNDIAGINSYYPAQGLAGLVTLTLH